MAQNITIPGGRDKGKSPSECDDRSLQYWADNAREDGLKSACVAELQRRSGGGGQQRHSPPQNQALAQRRPDTAQLVAGSMREPSKINEQLKLASTTMHLVSPATVCGSLPEGCEIALSTVHVNSDDSLNGPGEVYKTGGGKLGLAKATLDRIAAAAGITWDPNESQRIDDGHDPHYVMFKAVGYCRSFDGTQRTIFGTKEMDLRDGSPQIEALNDRIKTDAQGNKGTADKQIREMRLHILGHAETKARLRAVRSIGIKTGYTKDELQKPFVVARLMWTGRSADPELRKEFARMTATAMLGGVSSMYGGTPALPSPPHAPGRQQLVSAPPLGTQIQDDDYYLPPLDTTGEEQRNTPIPADPQGNERTPDSRPNTAEGEANY